MLRKAVRDNGVILGVGSQQRSDANFQHAVKMVQEGKIGKIERVNAYVGPPPDRMICLRSRFRPT